MSHWPHHCLSHTTGLRGQHFISEWGKSLQKLLVLAPQSTASWRGVSVLYFLVEKKHSSLYHLLWGHPPTPSELSHQLFPVLPAAGILNLGEGSSQISLMVIFS